MLAHAIKLQRKTRAQCNLNFLFILCCRRRRPRVTSTMADVGGGAGAKEGRLRMVSQIYYPRKLFNYRGIFLLPLPVCPTYFHSAAPLNFNFTCAQARLRIRAYHYTALRVIYCNCIPTHRHTDLDSDKSTRSNML